MHVVAVEEEVGDVSMGSPHVVLLGAGASRAAFPNGEGNGHQLPLMADFADIVPVKQILRAAGFDPARNFEYSYSAMAVNPQLAHARVKLEQTIFQYFDELQLPDEPTLYDHLLLSLRGKDVIATFNWDPFLMQAARRSGLKEEQMPKFLFLHGNVFVGFCVEDQRMGPSGGICSGCGHPFEPMKLLYPVSDKNYAGEPGIAHAWKALDFVLERCFWLTVFGYSAPVSDGSAVSLLKSAWNRVGKRKLAQVEVIDIQDTKSIEEAWETFTYSHHYETHGSFYDSWVARHPRRTIEAFKRQFLDAEFIEDNRFPRDAGWKELREWFKPLLEAEQRSRKSAG